MTTNEDILHLAQTLYGETRGETFKGKCAVAWVIVNRRDDRRWPNTIPEVCRQPWQFSCWNPSDPNSKLNLTVLDLPHNRAFRDCWAAATSVLEGLVPDITGGANHYFNPKVVQPTWAKGVQPSATIGNHVFLEL